MAKIIVQPGHNVRALAAHAGSNLQQLRFRPNEQELEVVDVTQPALDAALVDYTANQAAIDAAFQVSQDAATVGELQQQYNNDPVLIAIVDALREELNDLRALHSLPDIPAGQMNGKVHQKIATP